VEDSGVYWAMDDELAHAFPFWRTIGFLGPVMHVIGHVKLELGKGDIEKRLCRFLCGPNDGLDAIVMFVAQEEVPKEMSVSADDKRFGTLT
jgi:hypothetical protein